MTALYLRISEDKTGLQLGVDRQEEDCRKLCERMGWEVTAVYRDNDVSAMHAKVRPAFEQMLQDAPSRIVMWSVDRLVRRGPDLERLIELDIPVHSVMAGPMDLATASGRLNARLLTSVATFESEIKSERQKRALQQRAERGLAWWTKRPFGYEMDKRLRPTEAAIIRELYEGLLAGRSLYSMAEELNARGICTSQGAKWRGARLGELLRHPRNAGIRTYQGVEIGPGEWPAIVSEATYRQALEALSKPSRRTHWGYDPKQGALHLLSGLAFCSVCDAKMTTSGVRPSPKAERQVYYVCREGRCAAQPAAKVNAYVEGLALGRLATEEGKRAWESEGVGADLAAIWAEIEQLKGLLADLMAERVAGQLTKEEHQAGSQAARDRLRVLEAQEREIASQRRADGARSTASEVLDTWDTMELALKREVIRVMVGEIALRPRGRGARTWTPDSVILLRAGTEKAPTP